MKLIEFKGVKRRTRCIRGHDLNDDNIRMATGRNGSPKRLCKTCATNREKQREAERPHRNKYKLYPKQSKARSILNSAVNRGAIYKPNHCTKCGMHVIPHRLHGHHEDYDKPLDVIWVCTQCHKDIHRTHEEM